jgi:hypothetical protein
MARPVGPSTSTMSTSTIGMSKGDPVTYEELTPEHNQKFDEIKAVFEVELIGSFERARHHGIWWKRFSPEGALDGVDLSLPSEERTRALRQEVNYMVAHSLHRHSESLVNAFERVTLCVIQEIMKNQYSPSGPTLGSHKGELSFQTRQPLPYTFAALESHNALAYVIYKVGGDPVDYQFFNEPPKEVPHGYTCAYIPDSSNPVRSIQQVDGGVSRMDANKQAWLAKYATGPSHDNTYSDLGAQTTDQISAILRDQFGILPKRRTIGNTKPYPSDYDLIPLPPSIGSLSSPSSVDQKSLAPSST